MSNKDKQTNILFVAQQGRSGTFQPIMVEFYLVEVILEEIKLMMISSGGIRPFVWLSEILELRGC